MGITMSRDYLPPESFTIFTPPPWPQEHTDKEGKVEAYKVGGRWQNPWAEEKPSPLGFFWSALTGKDRSEIPNAEQLDTTLPVTKPVWNKTSNARVHEMTWWEERKLHNSEVKIVFTPANHWCKRSASDDNRVLWGSWAVIGPTNSFWFGGDTAYCEAFKQIGDKYGPFTMAAIPIGNYQPNWFMKYQHVHPGEAVEIHKDIRCKKTLGIHWGTFRNGGGGYHYLEPPLLLRKYVEKNNLPSEEFVTINIGESVQP